MTVYRNLEAAIAAVVTELRKDLNGENFLDLAIYVSGRIEDDIKVEFRLSKGYGGDEVKAVGGNLQAVVDEYLHRLSFNRRYAPLCLPKVAPEYDAVEDHAVETIHPPIDDDCL